MKKIKIIAIVVIAVVLLVLVTSNISCSGSRNARTVKAVKSRFHLTVHVLGQLKSENSVAVTPPQIPHVWEYTISFMAPEGKKISPGMPLLEFDDRIQSEQLMVKQAELETAQKELEKIRLNEQEATDNLVLQLGEAKVNKEKAKQKADQPEELQAANELKKIRMDLQVAELQEKLLQESVKNQKANMQNLLNTQQNKIILLQTEVASLTEDINKLKIKAEKESMVVYTTDWDGKKKTVGDNCWFGETIMELPDLNHMYVKTTIPEPLAGKIKINLPVEISIDSCPERIFHGKVKSLGQIFRTKSAEQATIIFDADISIQDPDPELMRPDMNAGVDIILSSRDNVLQVPEDALIYLEKGIFVMKKTLFGKKMVPVSIGATSNGKVEILNGLTENDRILVNQETNEGDSK